uniref:SET domain-containing protein n=1 Tax=Haemonchus placei TaxID=6290 RepID=A0A0N4VVV9_HAEPC
LSSTDDLVKRIVSKLDEHPQWSLVPKTRRLDYFTTLLRLISSRLMTNAHSIYFVDRLERRPGDATSDSSTPSGVGLFPVASWFNHSCRANLNSFFYGDKLIFVSAGIRKGEEICDNYGVSFFNYTREERKKFLAGRGFTCHCSVCVTNDSIDNLLESSIENPKLVPESISTVGDFKQLTNSLPDGHKHIETIAQTYAKAAGSTDPKLQLFLYEQILECQRHRGLHFSPEQIRTHLSCALSSYDVMRISRREKQVYGLNIQIHLFAALVRMRTFHGKLYPAYNAAKSAADEFTRMQETGLEADFVVTMEGLRCVVSKLKPACCTHE